MSARHVATVGSARASATCRWPHIGDAAVDAVRDVCPRRIARKPTRHCAAGLLLIALISVVSSCAARDPWQDARIESEVKARLVSEKSANLTRLGVVSRQAVVHLTGTVASAEQKALAETVAKSVSGVRRVVNALEVQPATAPSRGSS